MLRPAIVLCIVLFARSAHAQASPRAEGSRTTTPSRPSPPAAQSTARVGLELPRPDSYAVEGPIIRAVDVIADAEMRELLRNGFPAQLHFRVELWSTGGWFDDLEGTSEWDVVVRYEPLNKSFRVARFVGDRVQTLGRFQNYTDAVAAVERPFRAPIAARGRGRHYYRVVLDVEVLSLTDLDEVEQWLRGELRPAVRGKKNPGTALTRGLRTVAVRLLGGEKRQYVTTSSTFR